MSLFFGLNIALKGMMASQTALSVVSNNIANASTDGYTRQRTDLVESDAISGLVSGAQLGSGVDVADVTRIRNEFTDYQIRTQTSELDYDTTLHDTLSNVETVFNETSSDTGLSDALDTFWGDWQDVSTTPDSSSVRTTLMEDAVSLTDTLRQLSSQLTTIQDDIQTQISQSVETVNSYSAQIAKLNDQIVYSEANGETPNSLLDARDLLLDKLSALGNITVTKCQDGNGNYTGAIEVELGTNTIVDENGSYDLSSSDITSTTVTGGSLGALAHLSGNGDTADTVQYYIDKLNTLAAGIAKIVNDLHTTGTDLEGNSGENFFVFKDSNGNAIDLDSVDWTDPTASGITAANIYVSSDIQDDVSKIAASAGTTNVEGNGDIALAIADLKDTKLSYDSTNGVLSSSSSGDVTIGDFYSGLVTALGSKVSATESDVTNQQTVVDNLISKRESTSGVSVDEETTNMILYQHAYDASAKVISVIDEMLDTVINMKS